MSWERDLLIEFTEEVYHTAFDKALWSADIALEAMKNGPKDDPKLNDKYRNACRMIMLLTERWKREGHELRSGTLVSIWFRRISEVK